MIDLLFWASAATVDPRLCDHERAVMAVLGERGTVADLTLDGLCTLLPDRPREYVFAAVARLEDRGYLPKSAIR